MRSLLIMTATAGLCLAGCGGESFPETYPVTGVVTFKAKPVEGATVSLVPTNPEGRSAAGVTDAEGKFSVKSYFSPEHSPAGALPGDYAVTVSKLLVEEAPKGLTAWEEQAWSQKAGAPRSLLPKNYLSPDRSGLKTTVGKGPSDPLQLDLHE